MFKYIWFFALVLLVSCNNGSENSSQDYQALDKVMDKLSSDDNKTSSGNAVSPGKNYRMAVALEAIDAGTYTYVKLDENGKQFWAAITARPLEIGKTYAFSDALMMKDFESKQLNRTFDSVMFIQNFSETETIHAGSSDFKKSDPHAHTKTRMHDHIEVEPAGEGQTIGSIYGNLESLGGKTITVKGEVVKISQNIMNRSWIHIQDGTKSGKHYDLTITTFEPVNFSLGDEVTFTGTLSVDKDFGAGYKYDAILEGATWHESKAL